MTQIFDYGFTTNQKQNDYRIAIHEAGHAVVGHLVGVAIDHVALCPDGGGVSSPVRDPAAAAADKLWAEATRHQPQASAGGLSHASCAPISALTC